MDAPHVCTLALLCLLLPVGIDPRMVDQLDIDRDSYHALDIRFLSKSRGTCDQSAAVRRTDTRLHDLDRGRCAMYCQST